MSEDQLIELQKHLERLVPMLSGITSSQIEGSPQLRERLGNLIEALGDIGLLKNLGYLTIDQACTEICDIFQKGKIPRTKTFSHCGKNHEYHSLQCYVRCPVCKTYRMKTHHLFAEDDVETLASMVLYWLQIDPRSLPGWNPECDD